MSEVKVLVERNAALIARLLGTPEIQGLIYQRLRERDRSPSIRSRALPERVRTIPGTVLLLTLMTVTVRHPHTLMQF